MSRRTWAAGAVALAAASIGLWAPRSTPASAQSPTDTQTQAASPTHHTLVPWGSGDAQVGLQPPATDSPASGVPSLAVAADGSVLLLDRLNRRIVRLDRHLNPRGPWTVAEIPPDAEDVAVAADGATAAYSPLRARVWLHHDGNPIGEVHVPRGLRELQTISVGPSRNVLARSAHQETYRLGPPSAPQSLATVLHSKREGAYQRHDGVGIATRLDAKRRPELLVIGRDGERTRTVARHALGDETVLSARVVGLEGDLACVRLEHRLAAPGFRVGRSVVCLDTRSGDRVFERDLGAVRDVYVPRRSFATGGNPARLVYIEPSDAGLRVLAWDLVRSDRGGVR